MKPIANKIHVNMSKFFWDDVRQQIRNFHNHPTDTQLWIIIQLQVKIQIFNNIYAHLQEYIED